MALDKLGIYNDALLLLGQRALSAIDEDREPRHLLDSVFDYGAVDYCLELVKPSFAIQTNIVNSSIINSAHPDHHQFTLNNINWLATVQVFSDPLLDEPVNRFIQEGRLIYCELTTIYLRFVSSTFNETYAEWNPSFARVVSAYLAKEIALRIDPDELEGANEAFNERVKSALQLVDSHEPQQRSKKATTTLTGSWLNIYNDALLIMGLNKIISNDDDSHNRSVLDTAVDADLVSCLLEDTAWTWAITTQQISNNPSLDPEWGYQYAFDKPSDLHRLDGVFYDSYFRNPLKDYSDEQDTLFTDADTVYLKYVSKDFLVNPDGWPSYFRKLVASRIAQECYMSIAPDKMNRVELEYKTRSSRAKSVDTMQSPPRVIAQGSWTRARSYNSNDRRSR